MQKWHYTAKPYNGKKQILCKIQNTHYIKFHRYHTKPTHDFVLWNHNSHLFNVFVHSRCVTNYL